METLAPFALRLSCAAVMMTGIFIGRADADPASIDIGGIVLGSGLDDAEAAARKIGYPDIRQSVGTLSLNGFTTRELHYGTEIWSPVSADRDNIFLLNDQHMPQTVIGIWRQRVFHQERMPLVSYMHETLIGKFGPPLLDAVLNQTDREMLWNFGGQVNFGSKFPGSPMRYAECTRVITNARSLVEGNYRTTIEPQAAKCGIWISARLQSNLNNHELLENFDLSAIDLGKTKASVDYLLNKLKQDAANNNGSEAAEAAANQPKP